MRAEQQARAFVTCDPDQQLRIVSVGNVGREHCVVGANSVVTRDLPPAMIAAGAPAKPIRKVEFAAPSADP